VSPLPIAAAGFALAPELAREAIKEASSRGISQSTRCSSSVHCSATARTSEGDRNAWGVAHHCDHDLATEQREELDVIGQPDRGIQERWDAREEQAGLMGDGCA
jgi:hypothetical protein